MVNTQPPPIKEAGYPMNLGHDNVGWVAAGGNIFRLVFEADSRETVVGSPAIGSNRCSRAHSRLDERNEALGGCVLDTRHADTTGAPTPDFGGNRNNRFLVCFPPRNANFPAAHIGFVDLDLAIQKLSARSNHGPAQLMEPCPSRLITAQAEYSLNPKRTDAVLLIRHIPHRLEPKPQRFPRTLEDRPRGRRRLTLASRTSLLAPGRHPRLGSPAGRTPKPGRPTDRPKKIRTGGLRSEPVVKFHKRARVIDPANGMGSILGHHNILPLRERIGYPIAVKLVTEDVTWKTMGLDLKGRDELLEALYGGLGNDTIRHVLTNMIVHAIDEDNAELLAYTTIYYSREGRREDMDGPLHFEGPHRFSDSYAKMRRVGDEWQIAAREGRGQIFRRPNEPVALEDWAEKEGKVASSS